MNDILRRVLAILKAQALTMPQRIMLWAIQDLAKQEPPYSLDTSEMRRKRAFFNAVLQAGVEGVEMVWNMTGRDAQETLNILELGEGIERYARNEIKLYVEGQVRPDDDSDGWLDAL